MFGDYIARGSAGAVFSSPSDPNQVIKIFNLDARDSMVGHMNRLQFQFFEDLEAQQKQDLKTPGLPQINYTFTGEMTPEIMTQISESIKPSQQFDYASIKSNFRYGDKYAIILMDRVSKIGPQDYEEPLGRRGLTPMLRHAYQMGYYVRDLWPENKGMSAKGDIIWFDPMVAPVNPVTDQDREALKILFEWNEDRQRQYQEAVRDKSYFDYEHKAGLFYSEDTTTTHVTYENPTDPAWIVKARNLILNDNFEAGILDEGGNRYAQVMLGNDYSDTLAEMIKANPNGFLMIGASAMRSLGDTLANREQIRNKLWEGEGHDNTFWVFPIKTPTGNRFMAFDGVVLDGNYIFSDGRTGTYDTFPLSDLFDARSGTNPKYYLTRFTKAISVDPTPWTTINYSKLDKSFSAEESMNETAITNVTYNDVEDPEWIAAVPRQMLLKGNTEFGVLDEDGNRYAEVMLGNDYDDTIKEIIINNPNGFMMTWAGSQVVGTIDLDHTFWVYPINHKHVVGPDDASWDAVVMDGHHVMSYGKKGTYDSYPLNDLFDATTGENPLYRLRRFTKVISRSLKKYAAINYTAIDKSFSADLKNFNFDSENDNYWLRGGCGKAAAMISKDLDQKNIPYHYEIGLAYIEGAFMGNHIVVISEAGDQDHYGTGGAKKRWENMMLSELVDQELPASMVEDIITFEWHKVDPEEDWSVEIAGEYLPVSGPMITKDTLSMSAESYPTCYLCSKPAKIEVMTAIGMRNFCGNKCRGDYEGIDYGPDDYYISPKLEHDIELVSYDPGYIGDRYSGRSATLSAKCRNCDFSTRNQSFYQHHLVKSLKEWDEEMEEWWDTGEKCRHKEMQYLDYLENGEDAWGNIIAGHIVIGCPTCGFKDTLQHVNIPQGCDNRGRVEDYIRF